MDDFFNFMGLSESRQISYLNFDANPLEVHMDYKDPTLILGLSQKVIKQKRIVYDIFQLFGDVGGFNDFFILFASIITGFYTDKLMEASLV